MEEVDRARAEIRAGIERGKAGLPSELQDALDVIAMRFHEKLSLAEIVENLPEKPLRRLFREHLGQTAWEVVRSSRIELAKKLLRKTTLSGLALVNAVGYSSATSFIKAFSKATGKSPTAFRESSRQAEIGLERLGDPDFRRKVAMGTADSDQAMAAVEYLEKMYERRWTSWSGLSYAVARRNETVMAETVWLRIADQPREEQEETLRCQFAFSTTALFEFLLSESDAAGAKDV